MKFRGAISKDDYIWLDLRLHFSKPISIISPFIPFIILAVSLSDQKNTEGAQLANLLLLTLGVLSLIFTPAIAYLRAKSSWNKLTTLHETADFEIGTDCIKSEVLFSSSSMPYNKFIRLIEVNKFFLFYTKEPNLFLLPKNGLSEDEVNQLRDIFRKVDVIKTKKLFQ